MRPPARPPPLIMGDLLVSGPQNNVSPMISAEGGGRSGQEGGQGG
jgi:hypothetical protein